LLAGSFSDYKEQNELSRYISDFATTDDIELLIVLNRKKTEEVVRASQTALVQLLSLSDEAVLEKMARSNSRDTMLTFEKVALKLGETVELMSIREGLRSRKLSRRLLSVYALSGKGNSDDLLELQDLLRSKIPQKLRAAVTKSISMLAIRLRNSEVLEDNLRSSNKFTVEKTIEAFSFFRFSNKNGTHAREKASCRTWITCPKA